MGEYLATLNSKQSEAVQHIDGSLLVLAGAGTGKTKVLTSRIAHIMLNNHANGYEILAVTFTNKAAKEMKNRIGSLVGDAVHSLWCGTFHSIAARVLRRHAEIVGLQESFTIIDTDDQLRLVKQIMVGFNIDIKEYPPKSALHFIQKFKDKGWLPAQVPSSAIPENIAEGKILEIYERYQARLLQVNAVDFGDLLLYNIKIFMENPNILKYYHNKFKYILVDEYQDTNISQYLWLRLLAQKNSNICCVGDDDQSIYGWRGAEVQNILRFEKDFPNSYIVRLEQNYRSNSTILNAASEVISYNQSRLGKQLWSEIKSDEKVEVITYSNNFDEGRGVAEKITELRADGTDDIAVLVRAGFQTRSFESEFLNNAIPYQVIGGLRFYERKEIRDIIAYIRVMMTNNDDLAFERIINTPKRGIGNATVQKIFKTANENSISLFKSTELMLENGGFSGKVKAELGKLIGNFIHWSKMRETHFHTQIIEAIIEDSGYREMLKAENTIEAEGRLENLQELLTSLDDFESITNFLEHISLVSDADVSGDDLNMVKIMTLHAAKGLEFDAVFLPGWEENVFPSQRTVEESGIAGLEEERRLAYVGITRAKNKLYISHALSRKTFGKDSYNDVSRFIEELPKECCEVINKTMPYGSSGNSYGGYGYSATNKYQKKDNYNQDVYNDDFSQKNSSAHRKGQKVFHKKFGYGKILAIDNNKLEISFSEVGIKKIMADFIEVA